MPREFHSFKIEAVVLRHNDWGEADRILGIFTREMGKIRVIAKGARKIRSRKAGHLEPFTRVTLMLAKSHDLPIVTQAETVDAYLPLHENLVKTGFAAYVIELLDQFTYEEGQNFALYDLLVETLGRLSVPPSPTGSDNGAMEGYPPTWLPIRFYEVKLLEIVGFKPELVHCVQCKEEIQAQDQYFSAEMGGILCPGCGASRPGIRSVTMETLKYFRHFQRSTFAQASHARPVPAIQNELETLLQYYLTYLLERSLKSPAFIREVSGSWGK
jgi:DNA repair protein RecO (recombination protein O)